MEKPKFDIVQEFDNSDNQVLNFQIANDFVFYKKACYKVTKEIRY